MPSWLARGVGQGQHHAVLAVLALACCVATATVPPPPHSVLVTRVEARAGVPADLAALVEDLLLAALRRLPGLVTHGMRELQMTAQLQEQRERAGAEGMVSATARQLNAEEVVTAVLDVHPEGFVLRLTRTRVSTVEVLASAQHVLFNEALSRLARTLEGAAAALMGAPLPDVVAPAAAAPPVPADTPAGAAAVTSPGTPVPTPRPMSSDGAREDPPGSRGVTRVVGGVLAGGGAAGALLAVTCGAAVVGVLVLVAATFVSLQEGGRHLLPYRAEQVLTAAAVSAAGVGLLVLPVALLAGAAGIALVLVGPPL